MSKIVRISGALALTLLLAACGSGDNSHPVNPGERTLAGIIEDGPIAGARIVLSRRQNGDVAPVCGTSGIGRCETISNNGGVFAMTLAPMADLEGLEFVSSGGHDGATGVDFSTIHLRSPAELSAGREDTVTISPVTTLLAVRMQNGDSLATAETSVRQWLDLSAATDLAERPAADPELQRRTLLLTALALEMLKAGQAEPFAIIGRQADPGFPLLRQGRLQAPPDGWGMDAAALQNLDELWTQITDPGTDAAAGFKKVLIRQGLRTIAERLLATDSTFVAADPAYLRNLDLLAEKIVLAAGATPIPLGNGVTAQRIARYLFFAYELASVSRLAADEEVFASYLQHPDTGVPLEDDPNIAELASLKALYSAAVPLLDDEIPGDDNRRRAEYFYNSDLSPFYFAEKISEEILDDRFSDAVMLEIARGKAAAGLLDEAEALVETQIYQTQMRGDGYYQLALALIHFNRLPEAVTALEKAEKSFREVLTAKGFASIQVSDSNRLQKVASAYRRAGDLMHSLALIDYLAEIAAQLTTTNLYGIVIVGTWQAADEYLAEGRNDLAAPLVDFMYEFARETPANVTSGHSYFKGKVLYLLETAKRYADLGELSQVMAIYQEVQALRAADGLENLTAGETWTYMVSFVELLYQSGQPEKAYALAMTMPDSDALKAFKLVATYEAIENGFSAALAVIETYIPLPADRIEVLTYFANNPSREYIALALIQQQMLATARTALAEAQRQMAFLAPTTDRDRYQQLVQFGYVKIASLYAQAGDPLTAESLLQEAQLALASIAGRKYRVDSMVDIAMGYHALVKLPESAALLASAKREIDAAVNAGEDISATDLALMYERTLNGWLEAGFRQEALPTLASYIAVVRRIFEPAAVYAGNDHDNFAGSEVDKLLMAAAYSRVCGEFFAGSALLSEAQELAADDLNDPDDPYIWVEASRNGKLIKIAGGYANAGEFTAALTLARSLATSTDRHQALQAIAISYIDRDDFPDSEAAAIDTDHDSLPDFFHPFASAAEIVASGLLLDADCDDDGTPDVEDRRPLVNDPPGFW